MRSYSEHVQEGTDGGERVSWISEPAKVDGGAQREIPRERESRADRQARDGEARQEDEGHDAHGPSEANFGDELLEQDREHDAAARASACAESDDECASLPEPVAENGYRGAETRR